MRSVSLFVTPVKPKFIHVSSATILPSYDISPRQVYDIVAVSTTVAYTVAQYWKYPAGEKEIPDVEVFAYVMAVIWHVVKPFDLSLYMYLWLIGGICHYYRNYLIRVGKNEEAIKAHIPIQAGGHMSWLLLVLDTMLFRN